MGMVDTTFAVEEYRGERIRLEKRVIASMYRDRTVWCWEVLTGPAMGEFGGKCGTKAEARKWARHAVKVIGPERLAQIAEAHGDGRHASAHPEDRKFWRTVGCLDCRAAFDEHGLPVMSA